MPDPIPGAYNPIEEKKDDSFISPEASTEEQAIPSTEVRIQRISTLVESHLTEAINKWLGQERFSNSTELKELLDSIPGETQILQVFVEKLKDDMETPPFNKGDWHAEYIADILGDIANTDGEIIHYLRSLVPSEDFEQLFPAWYDITDDGKYKRDEEKYGVIQDNLTNRSAEMGHAFLRWYKSLEDKLKEDIERFKEELGTEDDVIVTSLFQCSEKLGQTEKDMRTRIKYAEVLEEIIDDPENQERTDELTDDRQAAQIKLREQVLFQVMNNSVPMAMGDGTRVRITDDARNFLNAIGSTLINKRFQNKAERDPNQLGLEHEVTYAALLLSPALSTADFARSLKEVVNSIEVSLPPIDNVRQFLREDYANETLARAFGKVVSQNGFQGWEGKRVMEVGGSSAMFSLQNMGADIVAAIWSDQPGYGRNFAGDFKGSYQSIDMGNFREFADPHSVDMICTSRVFDAGSGAEQTGYHGQTELIRVMSELLKDKGHMIHFDCPTLGDLPERYGSNHIIDVAAQARIYRYHEDKH